MQAVVSPLTTPDVSQVTGPSQVKTAFSCQGFLDGFMYPRPHYLKNAPGPPQILPQIQDGGQKFNMAAKCIKSYFSELNLSIVLTF